MPTQFQLNTIVNAAYKLIRSLSDVYGNDNAMKVYDDISMNLGEAKDLLWVKLFSGELITNYIPIEFKFTGTWFNKILAIKAVRCYGMPEESYNEDLLNDVDYTNSLKDAHTYIMNMASNKHYQFICRTESDANNFKHEMMKAGTFIFE